MGDFGLHVKTAPINVSAIGDNLIVPAISAKAIRVSAFVIQAAGTVSVKFRDDNGSDISGPFQFQAREGIAFGVPSPAFMFTAQTNRGLVLNLSDAIAVVGFVTYFADQGD